MNKKEKKIYSILDLFRYKSIRKESIGFIFISFTLHLTYYGGEYSIADISSGNETYYLGAGLGFAETLGYVLVILLISKLQRKRILIFSYIASLLAICCFFFYGFSAEATKTNCDFCLKGTYVSIKPIQT